MSTPVSNPNMNDMTTNNDEIDLIALLMTLLRGWKIIIACALLGLLLGVLYSRYVQPTYRTDALLQIEERTQGLAALGTNISELVGAEASPAETERELIKSRMVLTPVINKLHLDTVISNQTIGFLDRIAQGGISTTLHSTESSVLETNTGVANINLFEVPQAYLDRDFTLVKTAEGFDLSIEDSITNTMFHYTGQIGSPNVLKTPYGDIHLTVTALPDPQTPLTLTKLSPPAAIEKLSQSLSVSERGKQTGIIELAMIGDDQEQVSLILTEVVQSYVNQNSSRGSEQTTTTIEFMETQIPLLKQRLSASEDSFNDFREEYGTIDVGKEAELLLTESSQIDSQLSELNLKLAELSTYYTDEHPLVTQINDQIDVLNERRQEIKTTITELPEIQREFLQLSEDMEINREIYLTMLKNYEQLKIALAGEIGSVRVVDMPVNTFEPIAPKRLQIWVLSLLLGSMLGSLLVLFRSLLRNTIKDPERLEEKTGIPVIATIPRSKVITRLGGKKSSSDRLLTTIDHDGLAYEGIKSLRTALMFAMPKISKAAMLDQDTTHKAIIPTDSSMATASNVSSQALTSLPNGKIIVITGEAPNIGKSFISSNLAETFSQLNKKILIIDGDMRRGELHNMFMTSKKTGLSEYLSSSEANFANHIQPTSFDFIDFMPRGENPDNPASLLASDKFKQLMVKLISIYDYIIIDTPPVLAVSDAIIVSQYADKVLMVTRYNQSIEGQLTYAVRQLQKSNIVIDGIVLNDITQTSTSKYSYHYNYAYGADNSTK